MEKPFSDQLYHVADSMGISLYQRFSLAEGAIFLRCPLENIQKLQKQKKLGYIQLPSDQAEFFGYQLLEYLLSHVSEPTIQTQSQNQSSDNQNLERILRLDEVTKMVGLSRTTLWRMERKGEFPARVPLSSRSVGWRFVDIDKWIKNR